MNEKSPWRETDAAMHSLWRSTFNQDWKGSDLSAKCPVCNQETLHRWYLQEDSDSRVLRGVEFSGRGRLWEWCSTCHTFEYYPDGFVPAWWTPPYEVGNEDLAYDPQAIEARRQETQK